MAITPIGASGAVQLPDAFGRSPVPSRGGSRASAPAQDRVSLSAESKAAGERELRLSPAELRAMVAPDSATSTSSNPADPNAAATSGEQRAARPQHPWTQLVAGDRARR